MSGGRGCREIATHALRSSGRDRLIGHLRTLVGWECGGVIAVGFVVSAASMRIRIPADLSGVGYDDIPAARHLSPPLTTVRSPLAKLARAAMDLIVEAMKAPDMPSGHVVVPSGMVIRHICGSGTRCEA